MSTVDSQPVESVAANDRGLSFGDGFFTTMRVINGAIQLFSAHLERIKSTSEALGIDLLPIESICLELKTRAESIDDGGLKLIITRGAGGQGYRPPVEVSPTWVLSRFDYPDDYVDLRKQGIRLGVSPIRLAIGHCYHQLKTLNRLEQVAIKRQLATTQDDDHICLDITGQLVEVSAANIFWRRGSHVYTPDLDQAGINGIMRRHVIALLELGGTRVHVGGYSLGALEQADEIFITNCLMPILPVREFMQRTFNDFSMANALFNELELSL